MEMEDDNFHYVLYNEVTNLFPRIGKTSQNLCFTEGQPVWVLRSKNRRKNQQELFERATVLSGDDATTSADLTERILVQYPKKSTYRVPRDHLLPVLGRHQSVQLSPSNIVLVCCETAHYRRSCVVHTHTHDIFLEIGCDYGITCERVKQRLLTDDLFVVGVDKSEESVRIAESRKGEQNIHYIRWDILSSDASISMPETLKGLYGGGISNKSMVVAVDINGNRELEAVQSCLKRIILFWSPSLIVCKSRALHNVLRGEANKPRNLKNTEVDRLQM